MLRKSLVAAVAIVAAACTIPDSFVSPASPGSPDGTAAVRQQPQAFDAPLATALAAQLVPARVGVLVSYDPAATTKGAVTSAILGTGAGVIGFKHLPVVYALAYPAQLAAIANVQGVMRVTLNRQLQWFGSAARMRESVSSIRADRAHNIGITGHGVGVAILDSGIDGLFHPGLQFGTKTVQNVKVAVNVDELVTFDNSDPVVMGASLFAQNLPNSESSMGHGTHVAGIVAGTGAGGTTGWYKGVAPGATLVGIATGDALFIFWSLAGFDYILDNQARYNIKVVNNSWGTTGAFDPLDPINVATLELTNRGISVVFASGNEGPSWNTLNPYSVAPWVIGVAAGCKTVTPDPTNSAADCVDPTGAGRASLVGNFSSRGIPGDALYHPTLTAPGVRIVSARASTGTIMNGLDLPSDLLDCAIPQDRLPFYTCASGTSMATPHVVGVVALMQEAANQSLTPAQVKSILVSTVRPMAGYALWEAGAGYLDAWGAIHAAAGLPTPP
jgi:serine protease AprX